MGSDGVVARIARLASPFARVATDGKRAVLAVGGSDFWRDALVVRTDDAPVLLYDAVGAPAAWLDRGWALVRDGTLMRRMADPEDGILTGTVNHRSAARLVAAVQALGVAYVRCRSDNAARVLRAVFGDGSVLRERWRDSSLPPIARARTGLTFVDRGGTAVVRADMREVEERLRAVEDWGAPPPAPAGSALGALGGALARDADWRPGPREPRCARADLIRALGDYARSSQCPERAIGIRGRTWHVFDVSRLFDLAGPWSALFAFAADGPLPPLQSDTPPWGEDVDIAPTGDVVFGSRIARKSVFVADSSMPWVYGRLRAALKEANPAQPFHAFALAASLLTSPVRRHGRCLQLSVAHLFRGTSVPVLPFLP